MSKKKYIRKGGICQFWDEWAENGEIDYQKLGDAIFRPESIESKEQERSEESYIAEKMNGSEEFAHKEKTEEAIPFNRDYKNYGSKN